MHSIICTQLIRDMHLLLMRLSQAITICQHVDNIHNLPTATGEDRMERLTKIKRFVISEIIKNIEIPLTNYTWSA